MKNQAESGNLRSVGPSSWCLPIAGTIGALAGSMAVHYWVPAITIPADLAIVPESPSPEFLADYRAAYGKMTIGNAVTGLAVIAACVALPMGFFSATRSRLASALMTLAFACAGGAVGGATSGYAVASAPFIEGRAALPIFSLDPMLLAFLIQFVAWGAIGLSLGIGLTCCRSEARMLAGVAWGLWGGFMAAIAYAILSAFAFPNSEMMQAVPSSLLERLFWAGTAGLCLGLSLMRALATDQSVSRKSPGATGIG